MNRELKYCVLCHRKAYVISIDSFSIDEGNCKKYRVSCCRKDCDATTEYYFYEKRAIEAWNRTFAFNVIKINCSDLGKRIRKEMVY